MLACPNCLVGLLRTVLVRGQVMYREEAPERCAGPEQHLLVADAVLVGWIGCPCNASGGHRSWACRSCGDVQSWPPHDVAAAQPYFGPGAGDRVPGMVS
ncbi:hypothetical protein [Catenuloplanes nepalensis]|uniref:hypothetical protein n=1 Tax=Catenuloplanes nepalensis TaxID=587533 RepID=UPI0027D7AC70|nr:hypothetical protein [Catenuloplanes nepalensis]